MVLLVSRIFFRLSNVVERIPYTDFKYLKEFENDNYLADGITELLYSTGVLQQSLISGDFKENNLYCLSGLGVKLLAYGLHISVKKEDYHGTALPIATRDDVRDILKNENIVTYDVVKNLSDDK